jgi:hypothetical protein
MDLAAVQAEVIAARNVAIEGKPFMGGLHSLRYYLTHIPDHFVKSVNPSPALKTGKAGLLARLKKEFGHLFKWSGGLFALGSDLIFTTVPGAWEKFKSAGNPIQGTKDAFAELAKGSVLAAGGLGAAAVYAALFPAVGLPGLIISNVVYEGGKKLVSALTGLKQDKLAPYLNPDKLPSAAATSPGADQFVKQAAGAPIDAQSAFDMLSPESKANLEAALKKSGTNLQAFLAK